MDREKPVQPSVIKPTPVKTAKISLSDCLACRYRVLAGLLKRCVFVLTVLDAYVLPCEIQRLCDVSRDGAHHSAEHSAARE